jgi:hypothetical protein
MVQILKYSQTCINPYIPLWEKNMPPKPSVRDAYVTQNALGNNPMSQVHIAVTAELNYTQTLLARLVGG